MFKKYKNGVPVEEIAREYGLKKGSVYRAMKQYTPKTRGKKNQQRKE